MVFCNREHKHGGGICCFIKNDLAFDIVLNETLDDSNILIIIRIMRDLQIALNIDLKTVDMGVLYEAFYMELNHDIFMSTRLLINQARVLLLFTNFESMYGNIAM